VKEPNAQEPNGPPRDHDGAEPSQRDGADGAPNGDQRNPPANRPAPPASAGNVPPARRPPGTPSGFDDDAHDASENLELPVIGSQCQGARD
jgi:hypothetical protein